VCGGIWEAAVRGSCVEALRRSSRETVDGARPSRRAISRTPAPWARHKAMSSRSPEDRYRPETDSCSRGFTPPAWRNQRKPTGEDTPASVAASSVIAPAAIAAQNLTLSSRQATVGRPGDGICPRRVPIGSTNRHRSRSSMPSGARGVRRPPSSSATTGCASTSRTSSPVWFVVLTARLWPGPAAQWKARNKPHRGDRA